MPLTVSCIACLGSPMIGNCYVSNGAISDELRVASLEKIRQWRNMKKMQKISESITHCYAVWGRESANGELQAGPQGHKKKTVSGDQNKAARGTRFGSRSSSSLTWLGTKRASASILALWSHVFSCWLRLRYWLQAIFGYWLLCWSRITFDICSRLRPLSKANKLQIRLIVFYDRLLDNYLNADMPTFPNSGNYVHTYQVFQDKLMSYHFPASSSASAHNRFKRLVSVSAQSSRCFLN